MSTFHIDNAGAEQVVYHYNKAFGVVGGKQFQKPLLARTLSYPAVDSAARQTFRLVHLVGCELTMVKLWPAVAAGRLLATPNLDKLPA